MEDWRPTTDIGALVRRAELLAAIRNFFAERGVLEVETPLLGSATGTDPYLAAISCEDPRLAPASDTRWYLQTSPEFAMKRLLAAGSGAIYQICKAFRGGEAGRLHNPEFSILEWYRPGFDHHRLMDEVDELLHTVLSTPPGARHSYRELFLEQLEVDPLEAPTAELRRLAQRLIEGAPELGEDRDGWLDLLLTHVVEPRLGRGRPSFVYDYPASQAALARIRPGHPPVGERFEVYVEGVELANGYHELGDAGEQEARFAADLEQRRSLGLSQPPLDRRLLAALAHGLPDCAGVALGVDRLLMLAHGASRLDQVTSFTADRA